MNKCEAEKILEKYIKSIFGFTLKNCRNIQDAEDLSQDIIAKALSVLMARTDIVDFDKFIWTIAHNRLNNYYRDSKKRSNNVCIDELSNSFFDESANLQDNFALKETLCKLQIEIAYLSKLQRQIVIAYYFEGKKQNEISFELNIPLGTVKWHLFEAKKDLKRGMEMIRGKGKLKFKPIELYYGINGSVGSKSPNEFLRSLVSQNICYAVRKNGKTINEIADELGVSPVYIENEVEYLEQYGFLKIDNNEKYISNFVIAEPTEDLLVKQDTIYKKAAKTFANELYEELISSNILNDEGIICNHKCVDSADNSVQKDVNFVLWSLIPYVTAQSGEKMFDDNISFEEVATPRPDGAFNIYSATIRNKNLKLPDDYVYMNSWCGPMWNEDKNGSTKIWQIDSEWSDRTPANERNIFDEFSDVIGDYRAEQEIGNLSKYRYAWLAEKGYIKIDSDFNQTSKAEWQIVVISNEKIENELILLGDKIKKKYKNFFCDLKAEYKKELLKTIPTHLRKVTEYELQFLFTNNGWFILHCINELLKNGKLKLPREEQKKMLTTLLVCK